MVDRPPPSRFSVVERGGRLVVIDRESGTTPPTAAERMAEHDRRMGHEPIRPAVREAPPLPAAPLSPARLPADPPRVTPGETQADGGKHRIVGAIAARGKEPWGDRTAPPAAAPKPAPARITPRPQPPTGSHRKIIVTGKWWDAKGPRTIELGPKGQQTLSGGFLTLFFIALIAAVVALIVAPVLLFIAGFLLFRFGGKILGPVGAGIVDKAVAEQG